MRNISALVQSAPSGVMPGFPLDAHRPLAFSSFGGVSLRAGSSCRPLGSIHSAWSLFHCGSCCSGDENGPVAPVPMQHRSGRSARRCRESGIESVVPGECHLPQRPAPVHPASLPGEVDGRPHPQPSRGAPCPICLRALLPLTGSSAGRSCCLRTGP